MGADDKERDLQLFLLAERQSSLDELKAVHEGLRAEFQRLCEVYKSIRNERRELEAGIAGGGTTGTSRIDCEC